MEQIESNYEQMECLGKRTLEYDAFLFDDFIVYIREHYDHKHSNLYQVIYEDAYGDFSGNLLTAEQIKKQYNITITK